MALNKGVESAWWALKLGLGVAAVVAGLDKFFNLLTDWTKYLSPLAERALPVSGVTFMHVAGVIEVIVGLALLAAWTRAASYVLMIWLLAIAANLVSTGVYYDIAVRDVLIAIAAYTLARLTQARAATVEIRVDVPTTAQPSRRIA